MNVRDLITHLQAFPPDAEVHFSYDYGDHWHTPVAPAVKAIDDGFVTHSEYHRMDRVTDDDSARRVVILS